MTAPLDQQGRDMSEGSAEARELAAELMRFVRGAQGMTHDERAWYVEQTTPIIARALAAKDAEVAEARRERDEDRALSLLVVKSGNDRVTALEADLAAMLAGLQEAVHPAYCPDCHHRQRDHKRIGATCCQEDWCGCQREFHVVSPAAVLAAALASCPGAAWLETAREVVEALLPLASLYRKNMDSKPDDYPVFSTHGLDDEGAITVGDLRRARALLARPEVKTWAGR